MDQNQTFQCDRTVTAPNYLWITTCEVSKKRADSAQPHQVPPTTVRGRQGLLTRVDRQVLRVRCLSSVVHRRSEHHPSRLHKTGALTSENPPMNRLRPPLANRVKGFSKLQEHLTSLSEARPPGHAREPDCYRSRKVEMPRSTWRSGISPTINSRPAPVPNGAWRELVRSLDERPVRGCWGTATTGTFCTIEREVPFHVCN